ncbi:MAG: hypothetical protein IPK84_03520 [Candidatus Moraniibacteriota bacterium]|nr:MAG: hypothetical protein IPK84_03520 [Candidatus Moranbacteria bacterium]
MSLKKYTLPNLLTSLYESATKALHVIWSDRFVVIHGTIVNREGSNWIVNLTVQVHFKTPHYHGWTFLEVSVHVSESLRHATDNGPILVEVKNPKMDPPKIMIARVLVWKDCYNPDNPLDAWGRMYVRDDDKKDLEVIEYLVLEGIVD